MRDPNVARLMGLAGFSECETGGGCRAYRKFLENGGELLLTLNEPDIPETLTEGPVYLGIYSDGIGSPDLMMTFANVPDFLRHVSSELLRWIVYE